MAVCGMHCWYWVAGDAGKPDSSAPIIGGIGSLRVSASRRVGTYDS